MDDANHTEMTSQLPSPISKLDTDVVWLIFSQNIDMYNPIEYDPERNEDLSENSALETILVTSRVCRSWRQLLLDSPVIWGRLLRLDRLHQLGNEGRKEIMRRTGDGPLCLMGNVSDSEPAIDFFCSLLRNNWNRIQKIHVRVDDAWAFEKSFWNVFLLPAPSLEWFHIKSAYDGFQAFPKDAHVALFSNETPRLRVLHSDMIVFSLDEAHWMVQLRSLELETNGIEAVHVLSAIKQMPRLEYLHLNDLSGPLDPHLVEPKSIDLPHLIHLTLYASTNISLTFARSIKPAKNCVLSYHTFLPAEEWATTATKEVLDRYSEMFFPFWTVGELTLIIGDTHFRLEVLRSEYRPRLDFPGQPHGFVADLTAFPEWRHGVDSKGFFASFRKYDLSTVKMLNLELSQLELLDSPTAWSSIAAIIQSLSAVEFLKITVLTLEILAEHEDEALYFPRLRILRLHSLALSHHGISTFWKFYERMKTQDVFIEVVDLGKNPGGNWSFLEEAEGLKVTWKMDEMPSDFEYVCGSGDPEKLYFP